MATIQNIILIKIYEENRFFHHNLNTITYIIIILGTVWNIHLGIISVKCGATLPQKFELFEIFLLLQIFIISEIINTKH